MGSKKISRRLLLKALAVSPLAATATSSVTAQPKPLLKPSRLAPGDRVAIVAPAGVTYEKDYLAMAQESLQALELEVHVSKHVLERFGYLAGEDKARAADINRAFRDPNIKALFCLRGGWGAARLLPYLDFEAIAKNPKIILGYSDITTLLNAIYAKTGLVTFHGPNAGSPWVNFSVARMRSLLFEAKALNLRPNTHGSGTLIPRNNRIQVITPGQANGVMVGGNLTLLCNLLGTPYFPELGGTILLLEEIGEYVYRCDRMLTQLANAGVLNKAKAVVLGSFTDCVVEPSGGYGTFSLMDVFEHHLKPLNVPCFFGAPFGHLEEKYTLPIGLEATVDAAKGELYCQQSAVT